MRSWLAKISIISILFIFFATVFQNCAPGFKPAGQEDLQLSSYEVKECVSEDSRSCLLQTGTNGIQTCRNQMWAACEFESCQNGFYKSGNLCLPQVCNPNEIKNCTVTGGSGTQNCNSTGSALSACVATQCSAGYTLSSGTCLPQQCVPGQSYACIFLNGTGDTTCGVNGSSYSQCQLVSCDQGYYQSGDTCVAQVCNPNTQVACTVANGTGARTCNTQGSQLGSCTAVACNSGYQLQNGSCVLQNLCSPNSTRSCTIANGQGSQSCSADGSAWNSCNLVSCNDGFVNVGESCLAKICEPNSPMNCMTTSGQGQRQCINSGTAYGNCVLTSCNSGYQLVNGNCVANSCNPGTPTPCQENNGSGNKICNSDGQTYGTCGLTQCNSGYYLENGICKLQTCTPSSKQSCTISNGEGEKTCSANGSDYGSCQAVSCSSGYSIINNQCLICAPGGMSACPISNGAGSKICASNGLSWEQCTVTSCNSGYIQDGNTCKANPVCISGEKKSCPITNGSGEQTCNTNTSPASWGNCQGVSCNSGYELKNGQCRLYSSTAVEAVSTYLNVDRNFFKKQLTVNGLPLIGSANVRNSAFMETKRQLEGMFSGNNALWEKVRQGFVGDTYFIIIGETEGVLDIPQYRWLATAYPETDWNARARGFGGTMQSPYTSSPEENILCLPNNRYWDMSVLIHEMGHTVMNVGYDGASTSSNNQFKTAYDAAKAAGKWSSNTYMMSNRDEYFADGSLVWFDAAHGNFQNHPKTRSTLVSTNYDSGLINLLNSIFGTPVWRWSRCQY